ncbi:MAG: caspase family protein [Chitinophagales bacterium]|nr:caspase family protein [Hyphomicrobiales bacterium]
MPLKHLLATAFTVLAMCTGSAGAADIYVLSVGVNDYDHERPLRGAVADALDIRKAAMAMGAKRATVLLDREATRDRVQAELAAMLRDAKKSDTLIFSYAGHGTQEADAAPLDEADGRDEAFLLSGFDRNNAATRNSHRLLDDDIYLWLKQAGGKGVKVMFVADACHSGAMTRSVDGGDRMAATNPDLPSQSASPPKPDVGEDDLDHVTFFSATQESRTSPEVTIDGAKRGALSYAFARGIEGAADVDRNKKLTRGELGRYVRRSVRQISEANQTAEIRFRSGSEEDAVFGGAPPFRHKESIVGVSKLKVHLAAASLEQTQNLLQKLRNVIFTDQKTEADLVWSAKDKAVTSGGGDAVSYGIDATGLEEVIDKWLALAYIKQLVLANPLDVSLAEGDMLHRQGKIVNFVTLPVNYTYLTVFNLAPGGEVQFLYPKASDRPEWPIRTPYTLATIVKDPPFGAEHVVVLSTPVPLVDMHLKLQRATSADVAVILNKALNGVEHQIGLQGLYTASKGPAR